jgi:hypothetical protein
MIEEMISEDFPRPTQLGQLPTVADSPDTTSQSISQTNGASIMPTPLNFQLPFSMQQPFDHTNTGVDLDHIDVDGLLSFPGIFDFDSWS